MLEWTQDNRETPQSRFHISVPRFQHNITRIIPLTTLSKACVCGRLIADIASSNAAEGMDVRLLCSLCVVQAEKKTYCWVYSPSNPLARSLVVTMSFVL